MSKHNLALHIPEVYNPKIIQIIDQSEYSQSLEVTCTYLEVYTPGFKKPTYLEVEPGFNSRLSACALGLQRSHCGELQADLPDGIYVIKYSVAPNEKVYVEYYHLRVTGIMNRLYVAKGELMLQPCSPTQDVEEQLKELRFIEDLIDAAKIRVEDQFKAEEGIALLTYAKIRLEKYTNKKCSYC